MAFSHHKISIGGEGQSAAAALSYLADPQAKSADYYSESKRAPMAWAASERARAHLGLGDRVQLWKVEALLNGRHPITGELLRRFGPTQTMIGAIDVTESPAPKSVSILWALADRDLKQQIEGMVVGAVAGAVAVMTHHRPLVREAYGPTSKDVRAIKANDVVGLEILHSTARLSETKPGIPDPQLHVHALLFSDLREDGRLRAIDSRLILQHQRELDGSAQADLAMELMRAGFEIERTPVLGPGGKVKRIAWEVKGIPASLIKAMSGRSQEIEDLARRYREETGRQDRGPGWDHYVAARRGAKAKVDAAELAAIWAEEAAEHGLDTAAVEALVSEAMERARHWVEPDADSWPARQLRQEILRDLCRDYALVPERQLDALAQQRAVGFVSPHIARVVVARMFGEGDLLATTDGQVTTLEVLAQEQRAERALGRLVRREPGQAADPERMAQEIREAEERGRPFDPGQREAIALAVSGARFVSIAGPAGTGKGHTSRAMVNLWHDQGRRVFALAMMGRTTQQAAHDSGATPMTLDALTARSKTPFSEPLLPRWQLRKSDVLLVDEAAIIDHERYANLLEAAANAGATIVQIGDDHQLNPVGPGGLWTIFHGFAQSQGTATELREVHRARNPAEAQAWMDLREGRIEEALTWYRDAGRLRLYETRPELLQGMVADWWSHDRSAAMIVDSSNAERDSLNRMAQTKRLEAGELGAEPFQLANGREIRTGDRVIFADHPHPLDLTLNAPGKRVENGTEAIVRDVFAPLGTPTEAPPQSVTLEVHEPAGSRMVQVDASAELELGYARHAIKSQGMTVDTADIGLGAQTGQQELYEMASRARDGTRIHALKAELEGLEVDVAELEAARTEVHQEPQLAQMQLDRSSSPEMAALRMFNEAELKPGQVVSFAEPLPLREPTGVELGELGVVQSIHQGGITFDFGRVQLVGGRVVNVYQTDHVEPAPQDVTVADVFAQPARADQRNPDGASNLPLANGLIVQRGDLVRFPETQAQGRVVEVNRSPGVPSSRGLVEIESGQRVPLYGASNVEMVRTAQEIAAEHVQQVEQATIQGIEKQALRSGPKRAVGETELEQAPEAEGRKASADLSETPTHQEAKTERPTGVRQDAQARSAEQQAPEPLSPELDVQQSPQPAAERLREAAEAAHRPPSPTHPQPAPEPSQPAPAAEAHRQLEQQATDRSAGREAPGQAPPTPAPQPQVTHEVAHS